MTLDWRHGNLPMMRSLRRVLTVAVVIVAALVVAVIVAFESLDPNEFKGLLTDEVEALTGRKLTIAGKLKLEPSLVPTVGVEKVSFANAPWGTRAEMGTADLLEAQIELMPLLAGEIRIKKIVIRGLNLLLETNAVGKTNWQMEAAQPQATEASEGGLVFSAQVVQLRDIWVVYTDRKDKTNAEVKVASLDLQSASADSSIDIRGSGVIDGIDFAAVGQLGSLNSMIEGKKPFPVSLTASVLGAAIKVEGTVANLTELKGLNVDMKADVADWSKLRPVLGADVIPAKMPATALTGRLRDQGDIYSVTGVNLRFGKSDLTGTFAFTAGGRRPRIQADLASQTLDLQEILPPAAATPATRSRKVFSSEPLSLDGLRAVDADVSYRAKQLILPSLVLGDVSTKAALKDGRLDLPLDVVIAGGKSSVKAVIDASSPATTVKVDAAGMHTPELLKAMGYPGRLEGAELETRIDVAGKGTSVAAIMASLNGRLIAILDEGRIRSEAIGVVGSNLLLQAISGLDPKVHDRDVTELRCAAVRFDIKDGIATAENGLGAETEELFIRGSGRVNLKTEELDFAFKPEVRKELSVNLGGLASVVRLRGTLADPDMQLDKAEVVREAVSTGVGIATFGLSILAERLIKRATDDNPGKPCETALAEKSSLGPPQPAPAPATAPARAVPQQQPRPAPKSGGFLDTLKGFGRSVGDAILPKDLK
jgi:uncharacterized protein involved in outer membrane biogenesis